jgi:hypothetical protein
MSSVFSRLSSRGHCSSCAAETSVVSCGGAEGSRIREACPPQTTVYPCRSFPTEHLIRYALVAPRECRRGPPLLKRGPQREPGLLPSGPPQPSLPALPPRSLGQRSGVEGRAVRQDPGLDKPPQGHEPLARPRDHPAPAASTAPVAKALLRPRCQHTLWLTTPPAPGNFDGHRAEVIGSSVGDTALIGSVPTRLGRGGQAPERPHCLATPKGPPAEALQPKDPGPIGPKPVEAQEVPDFVHHRIRGRLQPRAAFGFPLGKALGSRLDLLPLLAEALSESRREWGAIPQAAGV